MTEMTPDDLGIRLPSRFAAFRPGQYETVLELSASDSRFSLLSSPTGTGKSLIYTAASQLLGYRTLILVGTKGLQQQLLSDFGSIGLVDIRGHGNYPCGDRSSAPPPRNLVPQVEMEESVGSCGLPRDECYYQAAIRDATASRLVVSNYAYWLTLERIGRPDTVGKFDLMILDEAHTAPDWLASFCSFDLHHVDLTRLLGIPLPGTSENWRRWAGETAKLATKKADTATPATELQLRGLALNLRRMSDSGTEWIVDRQTWGVRLTPVFPRAYAEPFLFRGTGRVVLCSATLSPHVARQLGVDSFDYLEPGSGFDPDRRPFVFVPTTRVDHRMTEGQVRQWVNRIDSIIESRLDRKGIIHTRSYARAKEIASRSRYSSHFITHSTGREMRRAVDQFRSSDPPAILVSPSVEEGFDFPGDLCRYQIIVKVPLIDTRDPLTKARTKEDKSYANYMAAQSLTQMVGRGMRSADDFCETFIVDDHWTWFKKKAEFPKWFRRSWRWSESVPPPDDPVG